MFPSVLSGDASAALRAFDPTDPRLGLRILMVVESSAGGTGRHVLDLCEGLIRAGAEVHLIYSTTRLDRFFLDRLDTITGLRHTALPMRTQIHPSDPRIIRAVRRYLREHGPFRVIHGHSSKGGAIARLAALGTGVPAFYTLHGFIVMDPGLARWKRLFYRSIEVLLSLATSGIIAVSPEESRAAVRLGLGRSRVRLVPNGIGPLALARRGESRRLLGVSDTTFVVGFVGRLVEQRLPISCFVRLPTRSLSLPTSTPRWPWSARDHSRRTSGSLRLPWASTIACCGWVNATRGACSPASTSLPCRAARKACHTSFWRPWPPAFPSWRQPRRVSRFSWNPDGTVTSCRITMSQRLVGLWRPLPPSPRCEPARVE
ncbi:MAG: glycosyltransferase [Isosphaeraceae bacterium]